MQELYGYNGYQVIIDCWKVIRPNATWLSSLVQIIHARIWLSWLSGYLRLLEGYQLANVTWLSSLAKVHARSIAWLSWLSGFLDCWKIIRPIMQHGYLA